MKLVTKTLGRSFKKLGGKERGVFISLDYHFEKLASEIGKRLGKGKGHGQGVALLLFFQDQIPVAREFAGLFLDSRINGQRNFHLGSPPFIGVVSVGDRRYSNFIVDVYAR